VTDPYPLRWPEGWKRTTYRQRSKFKVSSFVTVRDRVLKLAGRLGGSRIVITSNLPTRNDGLPYANSAEPDDPGIAVWWVAKGNEQVMACDRWNRTRDNMHAVELSLAALLGLGRWGTTQIVERAFAGFAALPPGPEPDAPPPQRPAPRPWRDVLGMPGLRDIDPEFVLDMARGQYKRLARIAHPDAGGTDAQMAELNAAMEAAEKELERP
jgi:hypothetical protein